MGYFKHEMALVESEQIGDGTKIRAFAHIMPGARIGKDCDISGGVQVSDGVSIDDGVFIGANATFASDRMPRVGQPATESHPAVVKRGASIGANATIFPNVVIGENAMVGAGSVVTHSVPRNAIVSGNPANIVGYAGAQIAAPVISAETSAATGSIPTLVEGVTLHRMPLVEDLRGFLSFGETTKQVPFEVKRYFLVFQVSNEEVRGEHAHRRQHQFLICVHGRCHIVADDGEKREEFVLDAPNIGIYLPPMVWGVQYKYSKDAVLMALVSDVYDPADYIRDYGEFLRLRKPRQ